MTFRQLPMSTVAVTLFTIGSLIGAVQGATLYSSGSPASVSLPVDTRTSAPNPDTNINQTVASAFSLASDSILSGFTAEAVYSDDTNAPNYVQGAIPPSDLFSIAIYSDIGGNTPGALIGGIQTSSTYTRVDTGVDFIDGDSNVFNVLSFDVAFSSGMNLNAGNYWISIINETTPDDLSVWSWTFSSTGQPSDPRYASNVTDQNSAYTFTTNRSMVFTIEGTAVPEPSSAALLCLSLTLIGARRKRH